MRLSPDELWRLDAVTLAELVRGRQVAAAEVLQSCLDRIAALDPLLKAFVHLDTTGATAAAANLDRLANADRRRLRLAGVPLAVKAGEGVDSLQVERLRAAGCMVIGTTSVPSPKAAFQTWGLTPAGPTGNPWDPARSPGGSSAGSAAAVAAGMVPLATGADGAGSLRIPAAWSGVVGIKGTAGRVPRPNAWTDLARMVVAGPLARTVADAATYLDVASGPDERDPGALPRPSEPLLDAVRRGIGGLRAAWSPTLGFAYPAADVVDGVAQAVTALVGGGAVDLREREVALLDPAPAWQAFRAVDRFVQRQGPPPDVDAWRRAIMLRRANDERLADLFGEVDVLLTPTTPTTAHPRDSTGPIMNVALTWPFNLSGHPAISVPCGVGADGLPIGLQIVARRHADATVLAVAGVLERLRPWPTTAPVAATAPRITPS